MVRSSTAQTTLILLFGGMVFVRGCRSLAPTMPPDFAVALVLALAVVVVLALRSDWWRT
jgi:hypothetical protein